jgi:hypothetical protein
MLLNPISSSRPWEYGNSKGCGKVGSRSYGFPCFPHPVISMACFRDADRNRSCRKHHFQGTSRASIVGGVLCMRSTIKLIIASPTLLSILCLSCAKGPSPGSTSLFVINCRPSLPRLRHPHAHETLSLHGPKLITGSKGRRSREFHQLFGLRISNPG